MAEFVLYNARLVRPGERLSSGYLHVRGASIAGVGDGAPPQTLECPRIDAGNQLLTPGLVDMHTHGIRTWGFDRGPEHLVRSAALFGRYGTTTVAPTIVPKVAAGGLECMAQLAEAIEGISTVSIPGLHIEGPFVSIAGAACDLRKGDLGLLNEMLAACNGQAAIMSIAPEVPNIIPVIERLVEAGVTPFITHTRANVEETVAAIQAGARHATHFYDVFAVPEETDPGVRPVGAVEAILGDPRGTCDFICDGIHVHPMAIRAAVAAKGWQGVSLITDASFGAGLGPGRYETPWGYPVEVKPGNAPRISEPEHPMHGALAGSALTMDQGVNNLLQWIDLPPEKVWAMATCNPARVIGATRKGRLQAGMDADLVLWREEAGVFRPARTWVGGRMVYEATEVEADQ